MRISVQLVYATCVMSSLSINTYEGTEILIFQRCVAGMIEHGCSDNFNHKQLIIHVYRYVRGQKYFPNRKNIAKNLALEKFSNLGKGY